MFVTGLRMVMSNKGFNMVNQQNC